MRKKTLLTLYALFLLFPLVGSVYAENGSFQNQFLGSPLIILTIIIVIDIIVFLYRKLRR
ncbi:MAG: hypothetical protein ACPLRY_05065 [Candidatus Bathyarchaeales archaeon]